MIMTQRSFIMVFTVNSLIFFSYIGLRNAIMRLSRQEQELEKHKQLLLGHKNERDLHIAELKNPSSLKKLAQQKSMEKLRLSRIKYIPGKDNVC